MSITELLDGPRRGLGLLPDSGVTDEPRAKPVRPAVAPVPDAPQRAARAPFVVLVLLILAVGLVGLLLLNTSLQQGSFLIHDLETEAAELGKRKDELDRKVAAAQAPDTLAKRARQLGMVPNPRPGYLRLDDKSVTGDPQPAGQPAQTGIESPGGGVGGFGGSSP